jgi:uncharacterized protein YdaU (DUF1376 family)
MKLYVTDYFQDVRPLSLAARGAWMDLICTMWRAEPKGEVTYSLEEYSRLFGSSIAQTKQVINELVALRMCDSVTHPSKKVTLICRRMSRESNGQSNNAKRQARHRLRAKSRATSVPGL